MAVASSTRVSCPRMRKVVLFDVRLGSVELESPLVSLV